MMLTLMISIMMMRNDDNDAGGDDEDDVPDVGDDDDGQEHFPCPSFARLRAGEPRGARAQSHHREGDAPSNREPMVAGAPGTPCALGSTLTILTLA